jgi:NADH-quinone oxidoreductase subunit L
MTTLTTVAATGALKLSWLLLVFPIFAAVVLLVGGRRTDRWGHLLGCAMPVAAFVYGVIAYFTLLGDTNREQDQHLYTYIVAGHFQASVNLLIDPLSICFVLLITGVGSLIIIYSVGYMAGDPNRRRFFGYMNLFVASMLLLVLADNYLVLYVGWEGVGLASYLLIGFWQDRPAPPVAAKKAFVVNRVGDAGLTLAIFLMFSEFGTVSFTGVFHQVPSGGNGVATALGFLLLLGACGKSAQVPLQSWLLDAMEGPTPVSALIHAATMVTAGVYLLVRSNPILALSPDARIGVAVVGTVTLLYGGIIAAAKDDIKKSLAGSTMSQIGYMTLGAGLGPEGYVFSIALLLSHGFYKAGLFLGSGSVIHGMDDEQDMREYGGLARFLPVTYVTFGLAYLAIAGIPPLSGFFAKDPIIEGDFTEHGAGGWVLGICALIGAGLTAFYMTRMMLMTWHGRRRWKAGAHPHESPPVMTAPMVVIAIGSVGAGAFLIVNDRLEKFLAPVVGVPPVSHGFFTVAGGVALALALAGIALAWFMYGRIPVPEVPPHGNPLVVAARNELYGNTINEDLVMRPGQWLTRLSVYFDNRGVDGLVNTLAALVGGTSGRWRRMQTGFVRSYALSMLAGGVILVALLLAVRL